MARYVRKRFDEMESWGDAVRLVRSSLGITVLGAHRPHMLGVFT